MHARQEAMAPQAPSAGAGDAIELSVSRQASHTEHDEKSAARITDEAGDLAVQAIAAGEPDAAASKRVLRKIDAHILPFLCVTYALQFIDKTSLAYSSVYNIIRDTNLQGQ